MASKVISPKATKKAPRAPPEPESLRKLRALKDRITREYEQEKAEREAMENNEPIMPMSLAGEKSIVVKKDGTLRAWSRKEPLHPARVGYGQGHIPLSQDPADLLKEKLHTLKVGNKTWQHDLENELGNKFNEMTQLKSQNRRLREILTLREASNTRKEAKLESEIAQLKNLMDDVCLDSHNHEEVMSKLRNMNYEIQEKADLLKSTIEEQAEADRLALIRTYRVRIRDVRQQLANQEALNLEGARAWIARFEMIEADRANAAAYLATLEAQNQALREAKTEIKVMQKHQDEQRKDLTHKIALIKRENKRFEEHISRLEQQLETSNTTPVSPSRAHTIANRSTTSSQGPTPARSQSRGGAMNTSGGGVGNRLFITTNMSRANTPALTSVPPHPSAVKAASQTEEDKHLAEVIEQQQTDAIVKIRKVLETIRASLRQVRSAHVELIQERTELEIFLRKCMDDVRRDMYRAVASGAEVSSSQAAVINLSGAKMGQQNGKGKNSNADSGDDVVLLQQYGVKERRQLMEILNSKLQLLSGLHQTMFPHKALPEMLGDRLSALQRAGGGASHNANTTLVEEISQSVQFDNDVDTLWQRWQTWVRTESPAPTAFTSSQQ